jgi:hypothetical protein
MCEFFTANIRNARCSCELDRKDDATVAVVERRKEAPFRR